MFDTLGLKGKRAFANPLKPPPGHIEEPMIETARIVPPPPSTPRPQVSMHASAK